MTVYVGDIGWAVDAMKRGKRVRRRSWKKKTFLGLIQDNEKPPNIDFAIWDEQGRPVPWQRIPADILADNWEEVDVQK